MKSFRVISAFQILFLLFLFYYLHSIYNLFVSTNFSYKNIFYFMINKYETPSIIIYALLSTALFPIIYNKLGFSYSLKNIKITFLHLLFLFIFFVFASYVIFRNYPLSMDEYIASLQSKLFSKGMIWGIIPSQFCGHALNVLPYFTYYDLLNNQFTSSYLPGYSFLLSFFVPFHAEFLLNPLLSVGSLFLFYQISQMLLPNFRYKILLSTIVFVTPFYFLNSISYYSFPAHLFLNLLWLRCRYDKKYDIYSPWIGIFALNLHQPHCHIIFVLPFLIERWTTRDLMRFYEISIYFLGFGFILFWKFNYSSSILIGASSKIFTFPGPVQFLNTLLYTLLLFTWTSPIVTASFFKGISYIKILPKPFLNLLSGFVFTFLFYIFIDFNQGHGWGARYFYPVYANICFISLYGLSKLPDINLLIRPFIFITALWISSTFLLRINQAYEISHPFWSAHCYINSVVDSKIIIPTSKIWYGEDLIRNDLFTENRPVRFRKNVDSINNIDPIKSRELSDKEISNLNLIRFSNLKF